MNTCVLAAVLAAAPDCNNICTAHLLQTASPSFRFEAPFRARSRASLAEQVERGGWLAIWGVQSLLPTSPELNCRAITILCCLWAPGIMQFAAPRPAATRPQRLQPVASSRQSITPFGASQPAQPGPGDKLLPLLRTPFDLLALPGRVALGTLQSLPEVLEKM